MSVFVTNPATPVQAAQLAASKASPREPSPPAAAMSTETRRIVNAALEELDDDMRLIVILRDVEDMIYGQISDVLNIPAGTVKSRLHRARNELKEKLEKILD